MAFPEVCIVLASALFIIIAHQYYSLTGDRDFLNAAKTTTAPTGETSSSFPQAAESREEPFSSSRPLSSIAAPPPISEVLREVYRDENTAAQ